MDSQGSKSERTLICGDSFCGIFTLIKKEANVEVKKFKGGTLKGLTRYDNENRIWLLEKFKHQPHKCCIFNFGQVDLHFSFYHDLIKKGLERSTDELFKHYKDMATHYVDFIASLNNIERKIVFAIYPSPIETSKVPRQLVLYHILEVELEAAYPQESWYNVASLQARNERMVLMNTALEEACKTQDIEFVSVNEEILNEDRTVNSKYVDISPYNLHLLWEPLLEVWTKKFEHDGIGLSPDCLTDINSSGASYVDSKAALHMELNYVDEEHGLLKELVQYLEEQQQSATVLNPSAGHSTVEDLVRRNLIKEAEKIEARKPDRSKYRDDGPKDRREEHNNQTNRSSSNSFRTSGSGDARKIKTQPTAPAVTPPQTTAPAPAQVSGQPSGQPGLGVANAPAQAHAMSSIPPSPLPSQARQGGDGDSWRKPHRDRDRSLSTVSNGDSRDGNRDGDRNRCKDKDKDERRPSDGAEEGVGEVRDRDSVGLSEYQNNSSDNNRGSSSSGDSGGMHYDRRQNNDNNSNYSRKSNSSYSDSSHSNSHYGHDNRSNNSGYSSNYNSRGYNDRSEKGAIHRGGGRDSRGGGYVGGRDYYSSRDTEGGGDRDGRDGRDGYSNYSSYGRDRYRGGGGGGGGGNDNRDRRY